MNNYPNAAVYLATGDPATEDRDVSQYAGEIGQRFIINDDGNPVLGKGWQVVVLDSTMDVPPTAGAVAYWRNRTGYVVTTDQSVAGKGEVAGVFGGAPTYGNICCVQQQGPASVQLQTVPTSAPDDTGKIVIPGTADAKADVLGAGTAATYPPLGVSISTAVDGVFSAQLNLAGRP